MGLEPKTRLARRVYKEYLAGWTPAPCVQGRYSFGRVLATEDAKKEQQTRLGLLFFFGADYGARTRHLHLGKVALYQMS